MKPVGYTGLLAAMLAVLAGGCGCGCDSEGTAVDAVSRDATGDTAPEARAADRGAGDRHTTDMLVPDLFPVDLPPPDLGRPPDLSPDTRPQPGIKVVSDKVVYKNTSGPEPSYFAWDGVRFASFGKTISGKSVFFAFDKTGTPLASRSVTKPSPSTFAGRPLVCNSTYGVLSGDSASLRLVVFPISGSTIDLSKGTLIAKYGGDIELAWEVGKGKFFLLQTNTSLQPPALQKREFDGKGKFVSGPVVLDSSSKDFVSSIDDHVWVGTTLVLSGQGKKAGTISNGTPYLRVIPSPYTKTARQFDMLPAGYHEGTIVQQNHLATDGKLIFAAPGVAKSSVTTGGRMVTTATLTGKIASKPVLVSSDPRYQACSLVDVHAHAGTFLVLCYTAGSLPELLTLIGFDKGLKRVLGPVDLRGTPKTGQ